MNRFCDWSDSSIYPRFYHGKACVIIPCKDRNQFIEQSLPCWLNQTYQNFEIILVDYNSSRPVVLDVEPIAQKFNVKMELDPELNDKRYKEYSKISILKVPDVTKWNMSHALNYGIKHSTSDIVVIAGCDTVPHQSYLEVVFHTLQEKTVTSVFCGRLAFPRRLWYEINGYQEICEGWGYEDNDYRFRLAKSGYQIIELNQNLCSSIRHDNLGENNNIEQIINQEKCRYYANQYGLIGNYCLFPGNLKPIKTSNSSGFVISIAELDSSYNGLLCHTVCYADHIQNDIVFYVLPQQHFQERWSDSVCSILKKQTLLFTESNIWDILDNIKDENWIKNNTQIFKGN